MADVRVRNDELYTVREAMRELNRMLELLDRGQLEKLVLTQRNQMRAVVVSADTFSDLERAAQGDQADKAFLVPAKRAA